MKIKISYNAKRCDGAKSCKQIAEMFSYKTGTKTIECDEKTSKKLIIQATLCPTNGIKMTDAKTKEVIVDADLKKAETYKEIIATEKENFILDKKGYFLIRILPKEKVIEVGFCPKRNILAIKITGKTPEAIYRTILKENLVEREKHIAYLGKELQKAYIALQLGKPYIQDDPLDFQ